MGMIYDYYTNMTNRIQILIMVQRAGFEPAKHYALGPHPSPFDRSGTSALQSSKSLTYITMAFMSVIIQVSSK